MRDGYEGAFVTHDCGTVEVMTSDWKKEKMKHFS